MYKVKKAILVDDTYGKHIKIIMIWEYDENWKWIKWVKLDENILNKMLNTTFN